MKDLKDYPVIGYIITTPLNVNGEIYPSRTLEVIKILDEPTGKIYITNNWYKPNVPQMVHAIMVKEYIAR